MSVINIIKVSAEVLAKLRRYNHKHLKYNNLRVIPEYGLGLWCLMPLLRRIWRYHRGNQNPYIEESTTQWPKQKLQKDKHWPTKHIHKTKDHVTRTRLKTGDKLRCSGRVGSSCSTSGTRVNLVYFNYIVGVSFICGGNRSTRTKPQTPQVTLIT